MSKKRSIIQKTVFAVATVIIGGGMFAESRAAEPTHYFFMPTALVNQPGDLVLGFHEVSYALPGKLQLQFSLFDNIGRLDLAAKYGFHRNLAGGLGLAHSIISYGKHGVPTWAPERAQARFGAFLAYEFSTRYYGMVVTGHTQIGDHISIGADLGGKISPTSVWSFIWEAGISVDTYSEDDNHDGYDDGGVYLYGIGGIRFQLTNVRGLYFDIGVHAKEFNVDPFKPKAGVFFDIMYCFHP